MNVPPDRPDGRSPLAIVARIGDRLKGDFPEQWREGMDDGVRTHHAAYINLVSVSIRGSTYRHAPS